MLFYAQIEVAAAAVLVLGRRVTIVLASRRRKDTTKLTGTGPTNGSAHRYDEPIPAGRAVAANRSSSATQKP